MANAAAKLTDWLGFWPSTLKLLLFLFFPFFFSLLLLQIIILTNELQISAAVREEADSLSKREQTLTLLLLIICYCCCSASDYLLFWFSVPDIKREPETENASLMSICCDFIIVPRLLLLPVKRIDGRHKQTTSPSSSSISKSDHSRLPVSDTHTTFIKRVLYLLARYLLHLFQ